MYYTNAFLPAGLFELRPGEMDYTNKSTIIP